MATELPKDIRKVYISQISSSTTAPTTLTVTNISTNNLLTVNSSMSTLNVTGLTSGNSYIGGTLNTYDTLTINKSGAGSELLALVFNTERAWVLKQTGSGPSTNLVLQSQVQGKNFYIQATNGNNIAQFYDGGPGSFTSVGNLHASSINVASIASPSYTGTNLSLTNITTSILNITSGLATSITSTSLIGTNTTITNAVHTALSTGTLNLTTAIASTGITTGTLSANTSISSASIQGTNSTITNSVHTSLSTSTLNLTSAIASTGITTGTLLATTSISTGLLNVTNATSTNLVGTNISASTLNLSTGLTTGTILATTSISTGQFSSTNISVGVLNATGVTTSTLLATTSVSTGQLTANNISSGTLNAATGITTSSLLVTGQITSGQLAAANISTTNLYVTTLITGSNLGVNNTSTGSLRATGPIQLNSTRGILIGTSNDLDTGRMISALNNTISSGGTTFLTLGVTNSLNNQAEFCFTYFTSGSTLNRTSIGLFGSPNTLSILGSGNVGINNTNPAFTLDVVGTIDADTYTGGNISVSGAISTGSILTTNIQSSNNTITNLLISKTTLGWVPGLTIRPQTAGGENYFMMNNAGTTLSNGSWLIGTPNGVTGGTFQIGYSGQNPYMLNLTTAANVGINVTNPSFTLDVNGSFRVNGGSVINVQNQQDGGTGRGIYLWTNTDTNWGIYMGMAGASKSLAGATAVAGTGFSSHAFRFRANNSATNGFIWENASESLLASIRSSDGLAYFAGNVGIGKTPGQPLDVNGKIASTQTALVGFTNIVQRFPVIGVGEYAAAQTFSTSSTSTYTATLVPTFMYGPLGGGSYEQAVATGATRIYRLFAIYSDDIQNTGTAFQIRFNFQTGTPTTQTFSFVNTWGITADRRMGVSETQGSVNTNHVTSVTFVIPNGVTGKANGGGNMGTVNVKISYLEIQYIDQY